MFAAAGPFEFLGIAIGNLLAHIIPHSAGPACIPGERREGLTRENRRTRELRVLWFSGPAGETLLLPHAPRAAPGGTVAEGITSDPAPGRLRAARPSSPARSTTRWWRDRPPAGTRGRSCFRDCGPLRDPHPARSGVRRTDVPTGGAWPRFFRGCSGVAPLMQWRGSRVPDSFAGKRELSRPAVEALRACSASGRFAPGAGGAVRVTRRCRWRRRGRLAVAAQGRELQSAGTGIGVPSRGPRGDGPRCGPNGAARCRRPDVGRP